MNIVLTLSVCTIITLFSANFGLCQNDQTEERENPRAVRGIVQPEEDYPKDSWESLSTETKKLKKRCGSQYCGSGKTCRKTCTYHCSKKTKGKSRDESPNCAANDQVCFKRYKKPCCDPSRACYKIKKDDAAAKCNACQGVDKECNRDNKKPCCSGFACVKNKNPLNPSRCMACPVTECSNDDDCCPGNYCDDDTCKSCVDVGKECPEDNDDACCGDNFCKGSETLSYPSTGICTACGKTGSECEGDAQCCGDDLCSYEKGKDGEVKEGKCTKCAAPGDSCSDKLKCCGPDTCVNGICSNDYSG